MKKYLVLLGLMIMLKGYSQTDSLNLAGLDVQNTIPASAKMWYWYVSGNDTIDRLVDGDHLQLFQRTGNLVYPRLNVMNMIIGAKTSPFGMSHKLSVVGSLRVTSDIYAEGNIRFNNNYIGGSSSSLYFYDETTGLKTLAELAAGGAGITSGSGVTISAGVASLGALTGSTLIETGNNLFRIKPSSGSGTEFLYINPSYATILGNANLTRVMSPLIDIYGSAGFRLYTVPDQNELYRNMFTDNTSSPTGLSYTDWATYWSNTQTLANDGALMSYGAVKDYVASSGGGGGIYEEGALDGIDTLYMRIYKTESVDTFDVKPIIKKDPAAELHCRTVDSETVTTSFINAGNNFILVAPPEGFIAIPIKFVFYLSAGTAFSGGGDNIIKYAGGAEIDTITSTEMMLTSTNDIYVVKNIKDYNFTSAGLGTGHILLDMTTHTGGGTRTGWIRTWYYLIDAE